jgi:hypothetical protein
MSETENKSSSVVNFVFWGIITSFCLALALAVIIPNLVHPIASGGGYPAACINNLRQIDAAANQFALENHLTNGSPINFPSDLTPYIKLNKDWKIPSCPQGGVYQLTKVGEKPTCSLGKTDPAHVLP